MTDEERQQFIEFLRYYRESSEYGKAWADKAADEIERLAKLLAELEQRDRDIANDIRALARWI